MRGQPTRQTNTNIPLHHHILSVLGDQRTSYRPHLRCHLYLHTKCCPLKGGYWQDLR